MPIWTTPLLNDLLSIKEMPLRLLPPNEIKSAFLANAAPGDIAIIVLDDTYLEFLSAAMERGIPGPILLISPEPTMVETDLHRYNALVLDLKKMGRIVVKNIVHAILTLAARQGSLSVPDIQPAGKPEEKPLDDLPAIRERLVFITKKEIPLMIGFEVLDDGDPVTVRGPCSIKEVRTDTLIFHHFKHSLLFKGMKKDVAMKVFFPYKQTYYDANVVIQNVTDKEICTNIPTRLFTTRDMRIQPSRKKPVGLYMIIPGEPTTNLKVLDISQHGIGFLCTRDLPVNGTYSLTIMLPDPQAVVVTRGVIRFKKESSQGIRYGAAIHPHPWDEESIAKYIMTRESEIIGLLRSI